MAITKPSTPVMPAQLLHLVGHAETRRLTPDEVDRLRAGIYRYAFADDQDEPLAPPARRTNEPAPSPLFGLRLAFARQARAARLKNVGPLLGRRVLTATEQGTLWSSVVSSVGSSGGRLIARDVLRAAVRTALAEVGILLVPPAPDPATCPSQFADHLGIWRQCKGSRRHDPAEGHAAREWVWADGDGRGRR
ncbi:hypothetical protein ACFC0K_15680 [Streptomyces hydrogenans]|uniref:hypothetical protein n=1 Tax=Streptomyces hydrogenans TaxID=1873719 RepID=UPI0035E256CA